MKQDLIKKRNKLICKIWDENKKEFSMEELREIFGISLKSFYRIIQHYGIRKK